MLNKKRAIYVNLLNRENDHLQFSEGKTIFQRFVIVS